MLKKYPLMQVMMILLIGLSTTALAQKNEKTKNEEYHKPSAGGKYNELLIKVGPPDGDNANNYFMDDGFYGAQRYKGKVVPAGYWVYVGDTTYIWKNKDLANVDFEMSSIKIPMKEITLELQFEHHKDNKEWAERLLKLAAKAFPEMEKRANIPFPGRKPFLIYESPKLPHLGLTGPDGMAIASPNRGGSEWVMLHEAVHIWNSSGGPGWICEGLCEYIGYLLMVEFNAEFRGDETFENFLTEWRAVKNTKKDGPMNDPNSKRTLTQGAGKGMDYWQILHRKLGDDFLNACFHKNSTDNMFTNDEFETMLRKFGEEDPKALMQGWLIEGEYMELDPKLLK